MHRLCTVEWRFRVWAQTVHTVEWRFRAWLVYLGDNIMATGNLAEVSCGDAQTVHAELNGISGGGGGELVYYLRDNIMATGNSEEARCGAGL